MPSLMFYCNKNSFKKVFPRFLCYHQISGKLAGGIFLCNHDRLQWKCFHGLFSNLLLWSYCLCLCFVMFISGRRNQMNKLLCFQSGWRWLLQVNIVKLCLCLNATSHRPASLLAVSPPPSLCFSHLSFAFSLTSIISPCKS